jgi:membrane fusion protein (multidrug efflux system)
MPPRVLSIASALLLLAHVGAAAEVKGVALVKVDDPAQGMIPQLVRGHGTVLPDQTRTESFQRDGRINEIFVEVGEHFKQGDALLDFGAAPAAVIAYEQAKTALTLAEHARDRAAQLVKLKLATADQLELAEKAVSDAQLAKAMLEQQGSLKPSEVLTARFDGVVVAISVSKGDRIAAGTPLMTLATSDKQRLVIGIEASDLALVKPGLSVSVAPSGRAPFAATVRSVGGAIDPKMRLVPAFIDVPPGVALAGELVVATITVGELRGWLLPRDAVGIDRRSAYVFQVDEQHAKRVNVNIIGSDAETIVVMGDINPDLKLVVWGGYQLGDGDAVRTQAAQGEARNR